MPGWATVARATSDLIGAAPGEATAPGTAFRGGGGTGRGDGG